MMWKLKQIISCGERKRIFKIYILFSYAKRHLNRHMLLPSKVCTNMKHSVRQPMKGSYMHAFLTQGTVLLSLVGEGVSLRVCVTAIKTNTIPQGHLL